MSPDKGMLAQRPWQEASLFAALGDETRLRLLVRLSVNGPGSVAKLTSTADVSRQAIRKHLDVLAQAGLVRGEQRGREHIWSLNPERLVEGSVLLEAISGQWDEALKRLKRFVESN